MKTFGKLIAVALFVAAPFSLQWSPGKIVSLSLDRARRRSRTTRDAWQCRRCPPPSSPEDRSPVLLLSWASCLLLKPRGLYGSSVPDSGRRAVASAAGRY